MFGPDVSQNDACEIAKDKAKVYALQKYVPQLVESETKNNCEEITGEVPVKEIVVEKVVYVDTRTGQEVRHNSVSDSFSCILLKVFAPGSYHNRRCDSFN